MLCEPIQIIISMTLQVIITEVNKLTVYENMCNIILKIKCN